MADQIFLPRALDANGDPISGAKAYVYESGTSTPLIVYTDDDLTTAHSSPIVADAQGTFAQAFYSGSVDVKVTITDASDVTLNGYPIDPAPVFVGGQGASTISFAATATNTATNVQAAIEKVSRAWTVASTVAAARTALGLTIGSAVQAYSTILADLASNGFATVAQYRNPTADKTLKSDVVWDAMAEVTLTDGANISLDLDSGFDFTVTLGGNRTLDNPTNVTVGQRGRIRVVQDGTGSRTLSFGSNYEFAGGTAPTLTTTASAEDVLYYDCISATRILITTVLDIS